MRRHDDRDQRLAIVLAGLAGYVDAIGFLELGGLFVSFMSGNSTRLAVAAVAGAPAAWMAGGLIASFVAGVIGGEIAGRLAGVRRPATVLALVALLLAVAAGVATLWPVPGALAGPADQLGLLPLAAAMGAANGVFQRDGEVSIGVTYMTGTLVKFGQHVAGALAGARGRTWLPYLMLWAGLTAGACTGAALFPWLGLMALWPATALAAILAVAAR